MDDLIFIVGAPRSGTTLLRAMLNRHSRIGLCDETFFHYFVNSRRRAFGDLANPARRARAIDRYLATTRVRRLDLDLAALRACLLSEGVTYPRLFAALLAFYARSVAKQRAGEKTPQHAFIARELLGWYPRARIIHLVRDPRDVVASLGRMPWGSDSAYLNVRLWKACVRAASAAEADPRLTTVRYEQLIQAPEQTLTEICEFIREPFEPSMLRATGGRTDRWWFDRAHQAIEPDRVGKWSNDLSAEDTSIVEWVAGDLLDKYGYARQRPHPSVGQRVRARLTGGLSAARRRIRDWDALYWRWIRPRELASEERSLDRHRNSDG